MKNIIKRIIAYFSFNGEAKEMALSAAEIKDGKAFLHPIKDQDHIYCIESDNIKLFLNPLGEITENDITVIDNPKKGNTKAPVNTERSEPQTEPSPNSPDENTTLHPEPITEEKNIEPAKPKKTIYDSEDEPKTVSLSSFRNKKVIRFSVYKDEYDALMKLINEHGYKRAEYFLACANAAKKKSMLSLYNKYVEDHKQRRAEEKIAANSIAEELVSL